MRQITDLRQALLQQFESLASAGLTEVTCASGQKPLHLWTQGLVKASGGDVRGTMAATSSRGSARSTQRQSAPATSNAPTAPAAAKPRAAQRAVNAELDLPTEYSSAPLGVKDRAHQLQVLREQIAGCTQCAHLARCRKQTVFGVGNIQPRLCFIGEAPGADEDRLGEPFVGAAGKLLDRILDACKLSREEVFILNVLKCRPPGNRTPEEPEVKNCWPYAEQQLELLQPEFICCLGTVAARALLRTTLALGKLRQQFYHYRGSQVMVTYHPAYLLRNPPAKQLVWDDMRMLMSAMGVQL